MQSAQSAPPASSTRATPPKGAIEGQSFPTGVFTDHTNTARRIKLSELFPELADVSLELYRKLPMACVECGGAQIKDIDNDELIWCEVCDCRGYVCPYCFGARWLADRAKRRKVKLRACPFCTETNVATDKSALDIVKEQQAVRLWLSIQYPDGLRFEQNPLQAQQQQVTQQSTSNADGSLQVFSSVETQDDDSARLRASQSVSTDEHDEALEYEGIDDEHDEHDEALYRRIRDDEIPF